EPALVVARVQRLRLLLAHLDELEPDDAEALVLVALDDAPDETALHAVRFDHAESAFHRARTIADEVTRGKQKAPARDGADRRSRLGPGDLARVRPLERQVHELLE